MSLEVLEPITPNEDLCFEPPAVSRLGALW
jgi:hypothetical protein